jgi:hypothetical protein
VPRGGGVGVRVRQTPFSLSCASENSNMVSTRSQQDRAALIDEDYHMAFLDESGVGFARGGIAPGEAARHRANTEQRREGWYSQNVQGNALLPSNTPT